MTNWWQGLVWGSPEWRMPAAVVGVLAVLAVLTAYLAISGPSRVRWLAATLKAVAIATLLLCLLEPLRTEDRPRPGANLFVVLADNSRSVTLRDAADDSISEQMRATLDESAWQIRLGQDFDVRRYGFDDRLQSLGDWSSMSFDGQRSALGAALQGIRQRFEGQPLAGVLLLSDGVATDVVEPLLQQGHALPPIYPVRYAHGAPAADAAIRRVSVRQTNFEDSPVLITAEVAAHGFPVETELKLELLDAANEVVDTSSVKPARDEAVAVELRVRPESAGLHVYRLQVKAISDVAESTLANNQRLVMVQRDRGPYRLLYVAGRPNWEFKFLRRSMEEDRELDLVALLRIARKEPKFVFRDRDTGNANPLFQGFDGKDAENVEQYDQPVIVRIRVEENELRDGFPKDAETLFGFHALILDDVESDFFNEDQLSLIKEFVSQRGGGLLMLGGAGSFANGGYGDTPLGDMLPVYLDQASDQPPAGAVRYRMKLSREGWLQPWVRMRSSESDEHLRIEEMPAFETLNHTARIKPGATVLASVDEQRRGSDTPRSLPALVSQRYGKGRAGALMIGDYWKWATHRKEGGERDLEKAWRQMMRWLVSDVAGRVEAAAQPLEDGRGVRIHVDVRDDAYRPLDNAEVTVTVSTPDKRSVALAASAGQQPGVYESEFAHREAGPYLVKVQVKAPDGSDIGDAEAGWVHEPDADEFKSLEPNQALLDRLAEATGGETLASSSLESGVARISQRRAVVNETKMLPIWHRWYVFLFAALCLAGEWGLRRWNGLP
ncbi:MAG: hypothetical protein KDB14_11735 [Planctomycetales bacterium]|nr:hypothetical protein [Planctomycetales bacterium]